MGSRHDEELARTMTAAAGAPAESAVIGASLGRYRLERELGAGAMGVVHLAFDPDLERRIAIKVIKRETATPEARDRLLREARAMARLAHPNVVTVHEVGTANGRDFVAMELIDGGSLADWLRGERRSHAAVLDAYLAAGRGLAAAHAAGIVHRDFKPHNVLRGRDGRIVVTDFGLARDLAGVTDEPAPAPALDETLPAAARPLALTMTGTLLGTPAYMAPEQWRGGAVSPATDQFAFCVALWEALAGERPYPGPRLDDLRAQIARGPAALDAARIPRRLRAILRRGLAPEPGARWPSMEVLLAQISRARRRPVVALAVVAGALVVVAAIFAPRGGPALAACAPPRDGVWSPALRVQTQAQGSADHAAVLDAAYWRWRATRATACQAPLDVRPAQLACLDGVLNRFDAVRQAFARVPAATAEDLQATLVDPPICLAPTAAEVPRLGLAPAPAVIDALALSARAQTADKPSDAALNAERPDACAHGIAALALADVTPDEARQRAVLGRAVSAIDPCGDDRLRAELLLRIADHTLDLLGAADQVDAAVRQAELAAHRVLQPELAAQVAALHFVQARRRGDWDGELRLVDDEIAAFRARGLVRRELTAVIERNGVRFARLAPGDLDAITADVARWRPVAAARAWTPLARQLDFSAARVRQVRGDVAGAHAELLRLWRTRPANGRPGSGRAITGEVVDERGHPVADATVVASMPLFADSVGIGLPLTQDDMQIATTDAHGEFAIEGAAMVSAIAAQRGDRRSSPVAGADHVRLVVEPTRVLRGKVDLAGIDHTQVTVNVLPLGGMLVTSAPVAADGTFTLAGVTRGAVILQVRIDGRAPRGVSGEVHRLAAGPAPIDPIELAVVPATRALELVVRSSVATSLGRAAAWVTPGRWEIQSVGDLLRTPVFSGDEIHPQPAGDNPPAALAGKVRRDDLVAHVAHVPDAGEITVCACSVPTDANVSDQQLRAHISDLVVRCKHIGPDDAIVVIDVPPQQRFD